MRFFKSKPPVVDSGDEGLPDEVASYFRRLYSLGVDDELRAIAERVKAQYRQGDQNE